MSIELLMMTSSNLLVAWDPLKGSEGFTALLSINRTTKFGDWPANHDGRPGDEIAIIRDHTLIFWDARLGSAGFRETFYISRALESFVGDVSASPAADMIYLMPPTEFGRYIVTVDIPAGINSTFPVPQDGFDFISTGDTNGNGRREIVLWNPSAGSLQSYEPDSLSTRDLLSLEPNSGWAPIVTGNYVGSDADDIAFFNSRTGAVILWDVTKGSSGFTDLLTLNPGWVISTQMRDDFDSDGYDDMMFFGPSGEAVLLGTTVGFIDATGVLRGNVFLGSGDVI
ncbi:MAG TPA: hypothetical protein VED40_04320 [Azospirillaceae bacterium]|nr:hypothetical protein [Azospirillaceae bacterium]